jgi:hypothetical protein
VFVEWQTETRSVVQKQNSNHAGNPARSLLIQKANALAGGEE